MFYKCYFAGGFIFQKKKIPNKQSIMLLIFWNPYHFIIILRTGIGTGTDFYFIFKDRTRKNH